MANNQFKPNTIDLELGQKLKVARKLRGVNRSQLAKAVGVSPSQIKRYEVADNRISAAQLYRLSIALKISVVRFYEGLNSKDPIE